jgi:hypothetical protein
MRHLFGLVTHREATLALRADGVCPAPRSRVDG